MLAARVPSEQKSERQAAGHLHKRREMVLVAERTECQRLRRIADSVNAVRVGKPLQDAKKRQGRTKNYDRQYDLLEAFAAVDKGKSGRKKNKTDDQPDKK